MPRLFKILFLCVLLYACDHLPSVDQDRVVARAGSHYLYESELAEMLLPQISEEDSTLFSPKYYQHLGQEKVIV